MRHGNSRKPNRTTASLFLLAQSYLSIGLVFIQGIVLVPLYLEQIGTTLYGGWLASGNLIAYLSLFDFGLSGVIKQKAAHAYGAEDKQKVAQISGTGLAVGATISVIVALVGILLASYVPYWVNVVGTDAVVLYHAVAITAIASALIIFVYYVNAVSFALQRTLGVGIANLTSWSVGICITYLSLISGWGLYSLSFGYLARALILLLTCCCHLAYLWRTDIGMFPKFTRRELSELMKLSGFVFLGRISSLLISQSDAFVIVSLFGPSQTAIYGLTGRAKDTLQTVPDRISSSIVAGMAHLSGEGDSDRTKKIAQDVLSVTLGIAALCAACIIGLNQAFVTLWVGEQLFGGLLLTIGVCSYFFFTMGRNVLNNLLWGIGEFRIPNILSLIESVTRIALVVVFGLQFGLVGIPLGALLSLFLVQGIFLTKLFIRRLEFTTDNWKHLWQSIFLYPLLAFTIGIAWSQLPQPTQWSVFAISALSLGSILAILLWLLNDEFHDLSILLAKRVFNTTSIRHMRSSF